MDTEREPSVLVSCSDCGRLHAPESLFAPNPLCPGCRPGTPQMTLGDESGE